MTMLRIPSAVYDEIRIHGEQTYPHECCGVLLGRPSDGGWMIQSAIRAGNIRTDSAHNRYQIAPLELVKIERTARSQGPGPSWMIRRVAVATRSSTSSSTTRSDFRIGESR